MAAETSPETTRCTDYAFARNSTRILVGIPQIASGFSDLAQLSSVPALATNDAADDLEWHLETDAGDKRVVRV